MPGRLPSATMSEATPKPDELFKARLDKLRRWRDEFEIDGYGQRIDGLIPLAEARAMFDEAADDDDFSSSLVGTSTELM